MTTYPNYVRQMLGQARDQGQWYCGQPDAAALCFDVLALFPDCHEARALVYDLFCDEWMIYDNRTAIQQNIDEWDDRPHQQRRRLALSFRFMSRWEGWDREYVKGYKIERTGPRDAAKLLHQGHMLLLEAYCLGDEECTDYAWTPFMQAVEQTNDPYHALLWIGKQYADLGFFADACEVLLELCSRFDSAAARRLLAEVRWWRDNAQRIPWIPPAGDGSRYKRMMQSIDPTAPTQEEIIQHTRERIAQNGKITKWKPVIEPQLAALFAEAMPQENETPPAKTLVDWSFLDRDDGKPGELPEWAKKQMKLFPKHADYIAQMHRWSRPIKPPATPLRRDPNEPPFNPADLLPDESDLDDLDDDDDDDDGGVKFADDDEIPF
ncbi:MAG: hypothetical protein KGJ80_03185 [Chloroflexota bacterium]|nr:hypothetical protein [Chloroflexota bacterium]